MGNARDLTKEQSEAALIRQHGQVQAGGVVPCSMS